MQKFKNYIFIKMHSILLAANEKNMLHSNTIMTNEKLRKNEIFH